MRRLELALVPLVLGAVSAGCGAVVESAPFAEFAPRPPAHEIRFYSTKLPECPYQEVGLVSATRRDRFTAMEEVLDALRQRIREMGGDAVVGLGLGQRVGGGTVIGESGVSLDSSPLLSGTVVRFTDPECRR